jgi:predicted dehydrogenase
VIRVGFVGCGLVAQEYRSRLETLGDRVGIVAFCDVEEAKAATMARGTDARAYANYREMLEREPLDAVFDNLPPFARSDELLLAAERGCAIFTTKPLGLRLDTALASLAAIERAGVINGVGYMFRYAGITEYALGLLADRPLAMFIGHVLGSIPGGWSARQAMSGGQIVEQSTHMVDVARVFGGDAASVFAGGSRLAIPDRVDYPDSTSVTLAYESGAIGTILSTAAVSQFVWRCTLVARELHLDLVYDAGTVTGRVDGRPIEHHDPSGGYQEQIEAFIAAIETGDQGRIRSSYRDGVKTLATTLAANRSLETGLPEPVEF